MTTLERTLILVKPDAVQYADEILERAQAAGFTVLSVRVVIHVFGISFKLCCDFLAAVLVATVDGD